MSNPCFELWLLLHLEDVAAYDDATKIELQQNKKNRAGIPWLERKMKEVLGSYSESSYDTSKLLPNAPLAISRARELDANPQDRWPQTIGTRVYLLMESITDKKLLQ